MKKQNKLTDKEKAFRKAEREIELQRNGYSHPWICKDKAHKNKKKYDRKENKKELRNNLDSFNFSPVKDCFSQAVCLPAD